MRVALMLICSPLLVASAPQDVSFHGFYLGQTLEDARAVSMSAGTYGPKRLICTGDADQPRFLSQTAAEKRAGVIGCRPYQTIGGGPSTADLDIGDGAAASVEFKFYNGRMFLMFVAADFTQQAAIFNALVKKFGNPTRDVAETVTTRAGGVVTRAVKEWSIGAKTIRMASPDLTLQRLTVTYTDIPLEAAASEAMKAGSQVEM